MTTVNELGQVGEPERSLKVSEYDRVSSGLIAALFIVGFFVGLMFLIWFTSILEFAPVTARVTLAPRGRGDHAKGYERDMEEPGLEEIEDMTEPRIEETFEAVTDTVSSVAASLSSLKTGATSSSHGRGLGDSRAAGPGGDGDADIVPRWERWRVQYSARSEAGFAMQLDSIGVHLGTLGGGDPLIYYVHDLTKGMKKYNRRGGNDEKRLFFSPDRPDDIKFTRALLEKAGYDTRGKILMHFYPAQAEDELAQVESKHAGRRQLDEIRRTVFGIKREGGKQVFYVIRQEYRAVARK